MTEDLGGAKVYLKREDLNHTGAHKINNVLGQVLLAKKMGKTRVIAETGVGPEHAHLYDIGRAKYVPVTDDEAVDAFEYLSRIEGIIPAIESAHAVAYAKRIVPQMDKDEIVVITLSGRGDKDCAAIVRTEGRISMNKNIKKAFGKGKAFIPFITCGDPSLEVTERIVYAMEEAGADLIELGIPFSDPTAEGPVIQAANVRALSGGVTTDKILTW